MFDLDADGNMTMVTRGVCRVNLTASEDEDCATFALFGNAWRFDKGHKVVLELSQSDTPFLRRHNMPSTIAFPDIQLTIPRASSRFKNDFRG
jgi:predicted acyl esterase